VHLNTCQVRLSGSQDRCATWISSSYYKCLRITMIYYRLVWYSLSMYVSPSAVRCLCIQYNIERMHCYNIIVCTIVQWRGKGEIREERPIRVLKGMGLDDIIICASFCHWRNPIYRNFQSTDECSQKLRLTSYRGPTTVVSGFSFRVFRIFNVYSIICVYLYYVGTLGNNEMIDFSVSIFAISIRYVFINYFKIYNTFYICLYDLNFLIAKFL